MSIQYIEEIINDPRYKINPDGTIQTSVPAKGLGTVPFRYLAINIDKEGYARIKYKYKVIRLHRIIFRAFFGELKEGYDINHIDGNRSNNRVENLEQISHSENIKHSYKLRNTY